MKKILLGAILLFSLISCGQEYNDTEQSRFVVKKVLKREGMSKMTSYKILMLDASGIGEINFWIVDSVSKYKVGDRLLLQPSK